MKRKISTDEAARRMAKITMDYLLTLPVEERRKRIQAAQKVIKDLKQPTDSSSSEPHSKSPLPLDTVPLAARGG